LRNNQNAEFPNVWHQRTILSSGARDRTRTIAMH
jgi:hypothetical protein